MDTIPTRGRSRPRLRAADGILYAPGGWSRRITNPLRLRRGIDGHVVGLPQRQLKGGRFAV
ncbi:hypothetical protein, partial [Symmachiella dynata]|uniref:hypothetical protein n=1 Tax=Symmachiella dynata TaxID=2527995 RepID=UPI0030EBBE32